MKVIIAGSRDIDDYSIVRESIKNSGFDITEIVSGGARGVDSFGERYAAENNIPVTRFTPEWWKYKKVAGFVRNKRMAVYADALIAIQKDGSKGTQHMINTMSKLGKLVYKVILNGPIV